MAFAPGRAAYVQFGIVTKPMDEWAFSLDAGKTDVSNFDQQCAKFQAGLPVQTITMSGPYSVGTLGVVPGSAYTVFLGITAVVYVTATMLVTKVAFKTSVRGVARVDIQGVVNSNFLTEATVIAL